MMSCCRASSHMIPRGLRSFEVIRYRVVIVLVVAAVSAVAIASAVASSAWHTYYAPNGAWMPAGKDATDGQNHNHDYNDAAFSISYNGYPKRIYELTPNSNEIHYQMDSNGQHLVLWHDPVYYAAPHCVNRSGITIWSQGCVAGW